MAWLRTLRHRAAPVLGLACLVLACTAQPRAEPGPGEPTTPPPGVADEAEEVLGGLVTLLRDDILACVEDGPLPEPRRVDAGDDADLFERVGELRELPGDAGPVPLDRLSDAEMVELVAEAFGGYDEEDAARDLRLLATLGAVPPDADLRRLRVDVFADQVSGLYQRDREVASVRMTDPDGALTPLEQVVAAHELQHALADRHLGRPAQAREEREDADERRASLALVEGDASLTMHLYAQTSLTAQEREAMGEQLLERAEGEPLADYPPHLRDELRFPYTDGVAFVCDVWREGGWAAVDVLYTQRPPATSAQILWPDRYRDDETALAPAAPRAPDGAWVQVRDEAFGAAELLWLLRQPGGDPTAGPADARERAAAWAGGRAVTWGDGPRSAVGLALAQRAGEPPLCEAVAVWWTAAARAAGGAVQPAAPEAEGEVLRARADRDRIGVVHCGGDRVGVGIAPDLVTARRLAQPE
jgi:hypothetical protein